MTLFSEKIPPLRTVLTKEDLLRVINSDSRKVMKSASMPIETAFVPREGARKSRELFESHPAANPFNR